MDSLKVYSRQQTVDSKKSRRHTEESRQQTACSRRGQRRSSLSTAYCLLPTEKGSTTYYLLSTDRGIALVVALVISLAVMLLIISTAYFVIRSTSISGAGKRYATASEAADGAVEVMKDAINLILMGESVSSLPIIDAPAPCLVDSIINEDVSCTATLTLPGSGLFTNYSANITVVRLYTSSLPGSRLEFARAGGGAPATAVYFRINTVVTGSGSTRAETSALYRYVL